MVEKEEATLAAQAESFIGSFVSLLTNSNIRYHGFVFYLNPKHSTIGIRIQKKVKSSGTEGQRKDGLQVPPSEGIYEYLYFKGTEIKGLDVKSPRPAQITIKVLDDPAIIQAPDVKSPRPAQTTLNVLDDPAIIQGLDVKCPHPAQSTHNVLDDPAIIQYLSSPPASSSVSLSSSGALQMTNVSHNVQSAVGVPYFRGNHSLHSSIAKPSASCLPPLSLNKSTPAFPTYLPSSSLSQGLIVTQPSQQQTNSSLMNVHSAPNSANVVEHEPHPSLIPPISPGVQNGLHASQKSPVCSSGGIPSMTAPSTRGSQNGFPPISPGVQNGLFIVPQMSTIDSPSSVRPSSATSSQNCFPPVPPVSATHSLISPLTPGSLSGLRPASLLQQDKIWLSSYHNDYSPVQVSASVTLSSGSESVEEPPQQIVKPQANKMQGATASSQYHKTYHSRRPRDEKDKDVLQDRPSDQGYGKGRPKLPNGDGLHDQYGYKAHAKARGHEKGRDGLHGAHSHRGYERGRDYLPNRGVLHARCGYRSYAKARGHESYDFLVSTRLHGRGYPSGRTKALRPVEKFTEEFNFEAMKEKFNKEEVWGLFGESTTAAISGHKNVYGTDTNIGGAPEAEEDGPVKVDNTPVFCKDDFLDTLSSNTLDQQSGRGRVTFYERTKLDSETFGEIQRHQQGRGIQGPRRAGGTQGSYRGRGYDHRGRGRGRTVYSRVT